MQISVVVPVYNEEEYLTECLNSILHQTYSDLEIIVVDDGSTDQSGEICEQFQARDNRVKVIHKKNGGLISVWKCGVNNSKNDYICFVDSDDLIQKNHIRDMVKAVKKYNADLVLSAVNKISDDKISPFIYTLKSGFIQDYREKFLPKILTDLDKVSERNLPPNRWGKLIQKKHIINNLKYADLISYGTTFQKLILWLTAILTLVVLYLFNQETNNKFSRFNNAVIFFMAIFVASSIFSVHIFFSFGFFLSILVLIMLPIVLRNNVDFTLKMPISYFSLYFLLGITIIANLGWYFGTYAYRSINLGG